MKAKLSADSSARERKVVRVARMWLSSREPFEPRRGTGKLCNHSQESTMAMKMHAHAANTNIITTQVKAAL